VKTPIKIALLLCIATTTALAGDSNYDKLVKLYSKYGPVMTDWALVETKKPFKIPAEASAAYKLKTTSESDHLDKNNIKFGELYVEIRRLFHAETEVLGAYERLRVNYLQKHYYYSVLPKSFTVLHGESLTYNQCMQVVNKVEGDNVFETLDRGEYFLSTKNGLVRVRVIGILSKNHGSYRVYFGGSKCEPLYIKAEDPLPKPDGKLMEANERLMKQLEAERKQNQKQAPVMPLGFTRGNGFVPDRSYVTSLKSLAGCLS
jgi:hypothetical protein